MFAKTIIYSLLMSCLLAVVFYSYPTDACMCMPSHPQTHYCNADYAVVVRVLRRSRRLIANRVAYKVDIKKSYKMTRAGEKILKHRRLFTAQNDAMCGVHLEIGKMYVIAGHGPMLSLCSYIKEYKTMTVIERLGFARFYQKGCSNCQIKACFGKNCLKRPEMPNVCNWTPFAKCEMNYSACVLGTHRTFKGPMSWCHWKRTPLYSKCLLQP